MIEAGTNEAERGLNDQLSEEEIANQILTAVSEGDDAKLNELFSVKPDPDAAEEEDPDSEEDSGTDTTVEDDATEEADPAEDDDKESDTSIQKQKTSPADERLAKLEQELANAKAAVGRMSTLQSRLAQLERQAKTAEAKKQQAVVDEADEKLKARIAKLKEIDPDTAEILEALAATKTPATPAVQTNEPEFDAELTDAYHRVLAVHGDADQIFKHPYWHMWKGKLTSEQRAWAESTESDKVIVALNAYKEFVNGFGGTPAKTEEVVDATKIVREQKLKGSADSTDKPVKKSPKFDPDAAFLEDYAKIAKEAGITY